jgi:N-acetylneuraminic acid mutarotase
MKKQFTLFKQGIFAALVFLLFSPSGLLAQTWKAMDESSIQMHNYAVESAVTLSFDFKPHIAGGKNSAVTNTMLTYMYGVDDWQFTAANAARYEAVSFQVNDKGYIMGGIDENGNYTKDLWEYTQAGGWVQKTDFPGGPRAQAVAFVIGTKAYVGTGSDGTTLYKDFYEYNTTTGSWTLINSLPGDARKNAIAFGADGKGYVGTGSNASNTSLNDVWQYDTLSGNWTAKNNFTGGARTSAIGLGLRKKGYIGTGINGTTCFKDFWEYTPATDAWLKLADFPGQARYEAAGFVSGAKLGIVFGKNAAGTLLTDSYYYKNGGYKYEYSLSAQKICVGSTVVLKNLTDDPDAYKYNFNTNGVHRQLTLVDTIHYTPTAPFMAQTLELVIYDRTGLMTLGFARQDIDISKIDSIGLTTVPDTCIGGVGKVLTKVFSDSPFFGPYMVGPYRYEWSNSITHNSINNLDTLKNLSPGNFTVTITDGGGCKATSKSVAVGTYMDKPIVSLQTVSDTCLAKVGKITAYPQTLKLPYQYSWSNGKITASITNLEQGKYVAIITDKNGCTTKDSATVIQHIDTIKIAFTTVDASCNAATGSLTAFPSKGTMPYTYLWSTTENTSSIDSIPAGKYSIKVTDKFGCKTTDSVLLKTSAFAPVPPICMVTVDSSSKYNIIQWEKTNYVHVDSFIVYREITTNSYKRIGAVPYTALSSFTDKEQTKYFPNTGNPNAGTYRYKLQLVDECGNYSSLSAFHNTIFIVNNNGTFSWPQLYSIEGSANPVSAYALLRDDNSTGNWHIVNSVTGTQQVITDPDYAMYKNTASYRVSTIWGTTCTPSFLEPTEQRVNGYKASLSNVHGKIITTGVEFSSLTNLSVELYPNPFSEKTTIRISGLDNSSKADVKLYDHLGKEVFSNSYENGTHQLDRAQLANGLYFMEVRHNGKMLSVKKVVIND